MTVTEYLIEITGNLEVGAADRAYDLCRELRGRVYHDRVTIDWSRWPSVAQFFESFGATPPTC